MAKHKPNHDTITNVGITDKLYSRDDIPDDYHGKDVIIGKWLGEIFHTPTNQYYTQATRRKYYFADGDKTKYPKHICPGHWQGYRYAVQQFTQPGDTVFDPTVGTGSAVIEAINAGRNGIGIELEFPEHTEMHVNVQKERGTATGRSHVIKGDARDLKELLVQNGHLGENVFDLIVTGSPYPVLGGRQADAPERGVFQKAADNWKIEKKLESRAVEYQNEKSVGVLKGQAYWELIAEIYSKAISLLKPGGKFVTIIKDPTQNKQPYLLHKMIADVVMEVAPVKPYGTFIHKHLPYTLFMNTYPKQHPDAAQIPLYQTGTVLEKI